MNTFKDVWKQFKLFIRFDSETILKISQDRYETGNAFLVVTISLLALYAPIFLNSNLSNIFDLIFFGVLDGTFSWVFSSLVMWFALGRIFKENIDLNAVVTITGYSHGLIGFVALWYVIQSSLMNFGERINQVFILLIIFWIYICFYFWKIMYKKTNGLSYITNIYVFKFFMADFFCKFSI